MGIKAASQAAGSAKHTPMYPQGFTTAATTTNRAASSKIPPIMGIRPVSYTHLYAGMILQDNEANGFVINPFDENIKIDRQVIISLKQQQAAYLKRQQLTYERNHPEAAASNAPMEFHELATWPEKMLEEIVAFLKEQPVKTAYMQGCLLYTSRCV